MVMKLYVESVSPLSSKLKCSQSVRMSCPMFNSRRTTTNRSMSVPTQKRYTRFLSLALIRFPLYFKMFINTPFWIWKKRSIVKTNRFCNTGYEIAKLGFTYIYSYKSVNIYPSIRAISRYIIKALINASICFFGF